MKNVFLMLSIFLAMSVRAEVIEDTQSYNPIATKKLQALKIPSWQDEGLKKEVTRLAKQYLKEGANPNAVPTDMGSEREFWPLKEGVPFTLIFGAIAGDMPELVKVLLKYGATDIVFQPKTLGLTSPGPYYHSAEKMALKEIAHRNERGYPHPDDVRMLQVFKAHAKNLQQVAYYPYVKPTGENAKAATEQLSKIVLPQKWDCKATEALDQLHGQVETLLVKGADPDAGGMLFNLLGYTNLCDAKRAANEIATLLVQYGASTTLTNPYFETFQNLSKREPGNPELTELVGVEKKKLEEKLLEQRRN